MQKWEEFIEPERKRLVKAFSLSLVLPFFNVCNFYFVTFNRNRIQFRRKIKPDPYGIYQNQ